MSEAGSQASATAESESAEAAHRAKTEASRVAIAAEEASRSHRFQAGIWSAVNYLLGIPATVLAALAGVVAAGESETGWTVGLAIAAAILTGLLTYLKPAQHVADHRKAYAAYDGLQASAALVGVAVPEKSVEAFERLVDEKKAVDEHAAHRPWFLDRILQGRRRTMSWQLTVTMREGKDHALDFETEDEAKGALAEVNDALAADHPRLQRKPVTIAGRLVVIPKDVRSAEISERAVFVA